MHSNDKHLISNDEGSVIGSQRAFPEAFKSLTLG